LKKTTTKVYTNNQYSNDNLKQRQLQRSTRTINKMLTCRTVGDQLSNTLRFYQHSQTFKILLQRLLQLCDKVSLVSHTELIKMVHNFAHAARTLQ